MKFHERRYTVFALFVGFGRPLPWLRPVWDRVTQTTAPIFAFARDQAAIRSSQYQGEAPHKRTIAFGRIGHNPKGAAKWTHESEGFLVSGEQAEFVGTELWAPSWTVCERDFRAPDVYLSMSDRLAFWQSSRQAELQFRAICHFAYGSDLGDAAQKIGLGVGKALADLLHSPLALASDRSWGRPSGSGFTDAINDLSLVEPFRPSLRVADQPALTLANEGWRSLG